MNLKAYLAALSTFGVFYGFFWFKTQAKPSGSKAQPLTAEKTQKLLNEIKHQVLVFCIAFSQTIQKSEQQAPASEEARKRNHAYYRKELSGLFRQRQQMILEKYEISSDAFTASLKKHNGVLGIKNGQDEILKSLERCIKGQMPIMDVPAQSRIFSPQQLKDIYINICTEICLRILVQLKLEKTTNPNFDATNDQMYRKVINKLRIFDTKVEYLTRRGFNPVWGCPNELFFKQVEALKASDDQYKASMVAIENKYKKIVDRIAREPMVVSQNDIKENMRAPDNVDVKIPFTSMALQMPIGDIPRRKYSTKHEVKPSPQKNESDDLDDLLMQELLSRTMQTTIIAPRPPVPVAPKMERDEIVIETPKYEPLKSSRVSDRPAERKESQNPVFDEEIPQPVSEPVTLDIPHAPEEITKVEEQVHQVTVQQTEETVMSTPVDYEYETNTTTTTVTPVDYEYETNTTTVVTKEVTEEVIETTPEEYQQEYQQ